MTFPVIWVDPGLSFEPSLSDGTRMPETSNPIEVTYTNKTTTTGFEPIDPPSGNGQEEIPSKPTGNSDPRLYTEEELEAARRQEKDKLYKRMETMQETVARLETEAKERADKEAAKRKELEDAAKAKVESEMSAKELLAEKEKEWQMKMSLMEEKIFAEQALREQETKFAQLMEFRQQVAQQYSERIAPELLDLIAGETPEEIQASAEDLATRSERILAQTAEAMQTARQQMPTVRATAPASGENSGSQRVFSPEEIRGMSMSDYAKHRKSLLGGGAGGPSNRGLFG